MFLLVASKIYYLYGGTIIMENMYGINEMLIMAKSKEEAMSKYIQRQLKLDGGKVTCFKNDTLSKHFERIADRFNGTLLHEDAENGIQFPKVEFDGFIFGKKLFLQLIPDKVSDGYVLQLVYIGEKGETLYQTINFYPDDVDASEYEINEAVFTIQRMQEFS